MHFKFRKGREDKVGIAAIVEIAAVVIVAVVTVAAEMAGMGHLAMSMPTSR